MDRDSGSGPVPIAPAIVIDKVRDAVRRATIQWERFFVAHEKATNALAKLLAAVPAPPSPNESRNGLSVTEISRRASLAGGSAERIDAEFFRSEYATYEAALKKQFKTFALGERYDLFTGSNVKRADDAQDVPIVKQAVLTNVGVNWSAVQIEPGRLPVEGDVKAEDILLACTAHEIFYVGRKVDYVRDVPKEHARNVAVADVMILRPKEGNTFPGPYVAAFLRSDWGRHQVQRCIRGLRGGHVYARDLSQHVRVPIPSPAWLKAYESTWTSAESARNAGKHEVADAVGKLDAWLKTKMPANVSAAIQRHS